MTAADVNSTILAVWRIEQPRLITGLSRMLRDVPLAEDLTQEALLAALEHWPVTGVPDKPGAWLMASAKRRALDHLRRRQMLARKHEMLEHLQRKVDTAIRRVGQPQDAHKFMPHVTVGRLRHPDLDRLREWLVQHALYTSDEFAVNAFCLYSSELTSDGSIYRVEADYDLESSDGEIGD